jgi:GxxExxY protein
VNSGAIQRGEGENAGDAEGKVFWELSGAIIAASIEVHEVLGAGLLEGIYEAALFHELRLRGIAVQRQLEVPVFYKGVALTQALRIDLLVESAIVVELKSVEVVLPVHKAQLLSYLRLTKRKLGLLINFNSPLLKNGVHRVVNSHSKTPASSAFSFSPR